MAKHVPLLEHRLGLGPMTHLRYGGLGIFRATLLRRETICLPRVMHAHGFSSDLLEQVWNRLNKSSLRHRMVTFELR
jgi:hypothetical protein